MHVYVLTFIFKSYYIRRSGGRKEWGEEDRVTVYLKTKLDRISSQYTTCNSKVLPAHKCQWELYCLFPHTVLMCS